ncbi:BatA domain-containing protein [Hymenobacter negativus]|uniref:BatA domain-containing protein n=1 Tax=Hymenobacter negativus TaxID=2795026 RepID=A0ABS3QAJ0_9BACT|nr:BatA domain-containing protein [Hymenobacter negativus]MBO2008252.1 BatA domain-containing protein [Hymenobacter negativus]
MELLFPWFLMGLGAIAIPIVIHLLQLRRPQRLLFTNTAFIREVEMVTVRHRNLQHLLILSARVLGIVALVMVFCQPFIPAQRTAVTPSTGVDVLVDNSFSMQGKALGQGSLFGEAVAGAEALGRTAASGERFRLINGGQVALTKAVYQAKLTELKLAARNPLTMLRETVADENERGRSLYLFADFQKQTFNTSLLDKLGKRETVLVPVAAKAVGNIYVDSVWLDDAFLRVRTNVGLHIRLRNGGVTTATDCAVKVFLGDRQAAAYRVSIQPAQAVTSVVQVQVSDAALALGRVVTEDVPVTFDNTYYFTLQPAAAIRVMEIGEEPIAQQLYGNEPLFTYTFVKPRSVDYGALRQTNLVLVRELEQVDAGLREALRGVVKRGGSVVVIPSAASKGHESYQQLFKEMGLGAVQWETRAGAPELREVAMPNAREPFFHDVFGAQQRAVTMPRVAPVLRWSRTGNDILRLRDGESYLASFASGAGQVYVFSAPFAKEYSDFVSHALFVPVMYRMAMLSYQNEQLPAYQLAQAAVSLKLPVADVADETARADEAGFRLVRDSLTLIPAQRLVGSDLHLELPAGMDAPGFYQVQRRGKVVTTLAFNQDKGESNLVAYSADELRQMIGPNRPNIRVVEAGVDGTGLAKFQAEQTGYPLWRYFLALALACLLIEALLVRFGGRGARVRIAGAVA